MREAIFNILSQDLTGLKVLDLFAGTGSLGLEALSRGAMRAIFVDNARPAINLIGKNLARCGYLDKGLVIRKKLGNGISFRHPQLKDNFDLIFIDPPYRKGIIPSMLQEIINEKILSDNSRVIAESYKNENLPSSIGKLEILRIRNYGDTKISMYAYEDKQ